MKIELSVRKEWAIVQILGRIDSFTYPLLENDIQVLLRTGAKYIVFDLSENSYMNLNGIRLLLKSTFQAVKEVGGEIALLSPNENFKKYMSYFGNPNDIKTSDNLENITG